MVVIASRIDTRNCLNRYWKSRGTKLTVGNQAGLALVETVGGGYNLHYKAEGDPWWPERSLLVPNISQSGLLSSFPVSKGKPR